MTEQINTEDYINTKLKNINAELSVLAYICKKGSLEDIREEFFSSKVNRFIYKVIAKHSTVTKSVLLSEAEKHIRKDKKKLYFTAIEKLYNIKTSSLSKKSINYMTQELRELSESREILVKTEEIIDAIMDKDVEDAKKIGREISIVGKRGGKYSGEYLEDFEERKEIIQKKIDQPNEVGVPTGIYKFDKKSAGLLYGEFGIVLGESSIGKSVALENFGLNAWLPKFNMKKKGHNVLFVSLEMPKHDLQFRADSRLTRILGEKFRTGQDFKKRDMAHWSRTIKELRESQKHFFHIEYLPKGGSVEDIEIIAESTQEKYKKELDLIIIDYLNIMGVGGQTREWKFQADIAWGIKGMASDFNAGKGVAVWTANQVKTESQGKKNLTLADTKYAGAIGEVAPIVVGLTQSQDHYLELEIQFEIIKFRGLKKVAPIMLMPNLDIALIHDEELLNKKKTLE